MIIRVRVLSPSRRSLINKASVCHSRVLLSLLRVLLRSAMYNKCESSLIWARHCHPQSKSPRPSAARTTRSHSRTTAHPTPPAARAQPRTTQPPNPPPTPASRPVNKTRRQSSCPYDKHENKRTDTNPAQWYKSLVYTRPSTVTSGFPSSPSPTVYSPHPSSLQQMMWFPSDRVISRSNAARMQRFNAQINARSPL